MLHDDFGADINIDQVSFTFFGSVRLKGVMIKDYRNDTLFYVNRIKTDVLSIPKLYEGDLLFGDVRLDGLYFKMKSYKGDKEYNLDKFINLFDNGKPSTKKFLLKAKNVYITNSRYLLYDENRLIPKDLDVTKLNAEVSNFKIFGPDVTTNIQKLSFLDHRGLFVKNIKTNFTYTKKHIKLKDIELFTKESSLEGDVVLSYNRKDFVDFNNKVLFDIKIKKSKIATNDVKHFYSELGKNQKFKFVSNIKGTLNNFTLIKLKLKDKHNSEIVGNINFRNLLTKNVGDFYINGKIKKITSDYNHLVQLLPNVLGKKLPSSLSKLGKFDYRGDIEITQKTIETNFYLTTQLGNIQSSLSMFDIDNIDNASYNGNVILEKFNIGLFLGKKDLKQITLNLDVDGKGFKQEYLNTRFSGDVYKINYKGYNYTNININGKFENPIFNGKIYVNDPNLFMDFEGIVSLGKKSHDFDFHTKIDYANLVNLKLVKSDSIAIFKGDVKLKVKGNDIDNLAGNLNVTNTSYQNQKDNYFFTDFTINSSFDQNKTRTITINSPEIIEGKVVGQFKFNQLQKMVENSLGSLYANYSPNIVRKNQFIKFDFTIHNKIIEIFFPGVAVGKNTIVNGKINSDNDEFKFNFSSPNIEVYQNYFDKINIEIDNKNPLYNTYVEMDSIKTKYYKISNFSMINVTQKDTLFLRTDFKGGNKANDYYKINLYHTIDKNKNNIVGVQKSEIMLNDYLWFLNQDDKDKNRVVFDKKLKNFKLDDFVLSHNDQKIELNGVLKDSTYKDLNLKFTDVKIGKLAPEIESLKLKGNLNGEINFKQDKKIFQPTASVTIDSLNVNTIDLGKLNLEIKGDENLKTFLVNSNLEHKDVDSFTANGEFTVENKQTVMDLDLRFDKLNLASLSLLGGDVITNINGFASGGLSVEGSFSKPEINGRLFVDEAALTIPYMNVNYALEPKSIVDVTEDKFIVRSTNFTDTKYNTKGVLEGIIKHKKLGDWELDLKVNTNRLLALDTKDAEDAAYFGTAFIDGTASIKGHTDALMIKVNAKSEKGTDIKIPINDESASESNNYIEFLTEREKFNSGKNIIEKTKNYNGLDLQFSLDINENAEIEVILNRDSGHGMKGKGRGSLLLAINTQGRFNMWGDFQVWEGTYNFKYGGLLDKKFQVKKFGSIVWEGDPMKAILNLEAVYKTTANPSVLIENPSFNRKVPVDVVIGIHGNLSNPEPDFNINFPTVSSVLKSEIQYKLDDKDVRQTQALYLLSTGGFLSAEGVNKSGISNSLFETASGLFNNVFQDKEGKINLGVNYVTADKRPGFETYGQFGVTVSTKINDKITFDGKLGVPVGGVNESAVVGNVEIRYRVNEDGTLNLRMYNKENDINYIGQGVGYTQGLGVSYSVDFDTFKELVNKIFNKRKTINSITNFNYDLDSTMENLEENTPTNNKKDKKKNSELNKANKEAVPEEE